MARTNGGGLYLDSRASAMLEETRIEANAAAKGKAGLVSGSSDILLLCCDLDPWPFNLFIRPLHLHG